MFETVWGFWVEVARHDGMWRELRIKICPPRVVMKVKLEVLCNPVVSLD